MPQLSESNVHGHDEEQRDHATQRGGGPYRLIVHLRSGNVIRTHVNTATINTAPVSGRLTGIEVNVELGDAWLEYVHPEEVAAIVIEPLERLVPVDAPTVLTAAGGTSW